MASQTVVSTDGAISATFDARGYEWVTFHCEGLGAAETVTVNIGGGPTWIPHRQLDGTAVVFTGSGGSPASVTQFTSDGNYFQFVGNDPAATVTITATTGPGLNA